MNGTNVLVITSHWNTLYSLVGKIETTFFYFQTYIPSPVSIACR